jgi:type I restriction enzyme M protein
MAIKKSELYSTLWQSCDELRGGMDASQYKDYVLALLFIKYISDKYAGKPYADITVPEGASFKDMVALKGKQTIGEDINKKIIGRIAEANKLTGTIDVADFDDSTKLGNGKDKVDRLTKLICIFEKKELDFSKNKAEGDDILGDAYEYLMRHFATESGKSKGQFYTPAEVSRIMSKILGITPENTSSSTTVYDPTCGSGSLLLKVADEAGGKISIYGQENDVATAALARMNLVLHGHASDIHGIFQGNTLASPKKLADDGSLYTFDYVVANPPFSFKSWSNGVNSSKDIYNRFQDYGVPPTKNGDYAFLLHIIRSLKSNGKGAVILPHGVLFRGNSEATIRTNIIRRGYIKGIIGLPANLFYGTGIPACIIVLDKDNAASRKSIFMVDASKGFTKDGNKNRLRDQDIHKIVDVFNNQIEILGYSRIVPLTEIEEKEYNLNIPRYIDSQETEDLQDIEAHLKGGIPDNDIGALQGYWDVYPSLKNVLFENTDRAGYNQLRIVKDEIKQTIFSHAEFLNYSNKINSIFEAWTGKSISKCKSINSETHPKQFIHELSGSLLETFDNIKLVDKYDFYQYLMTYWTEVMQDDAYVIVADGWQVGKEVYRLEKTIKKDGKTKSKEVEGIEGIESKLLKTELLISRYFTQEFDSISKLENDQNTIISNIDQIEEEQGSSEEGLLEEVKNDKGKITKDLVQKRLKLIKADPNLQDEYQILSQYASLLDKKVKIDQELKLAKKDLEAKVWERYKKLTDEEIKTLVVEDKWMKTLADGLANEMQRISQKLTQRIKELAERYETPLPLIASEIDELEAKVQAHLKKMGYACI